MPVKKKMSELHAVPASCIQAKTTKSTIAKKSGKAKKGLGAKKVAKIDFESLEKDAIEEAEMEKKSAASSTSETSSSSSPQSIEFAYQNLSIQEKKNESKLHEMSEKKQIQAQRLGMGFGKAKPTEVGHSLDMVTIKQNTPSSYNQRHRYDDDDGDTFYNARSTFTGSKYDSIKDEGDWIVIPDNKNKSSSSNRSGGARSYDTIEPIVQSHQAESNLFGKSIGKKPSKSQTQSSRSSQMENVSRNSKFVSSDQLFPSQQQHHQQQMNQGRMEGRSGISSDDFYGRPAQNHGNNFQQHVPDMYDVKEGVRQGVRSMAGKLSSVVGAISEAIEERRYN